MRLFLLAIPSEVPQYIPWFGALKTGVVEVCIDRSESIVQHSRTIQGMCLGLRVLPGVYGILERAALVDLGMESVVWP